MTGSWFRTRGSDGTVGDFPVGWVIGGKRMQDSLTVLADGRWQVLPVYFHVTGHEWVDYTEKKQGPLTPDHPYFWANYRRMANHECLDCHTTGLQVSFNPAAGRWTTGFADAGVACEDCHGPGAHHAETMARADIFRPDKAPRDQSVSVCAQCHGPRNPLFPLLDARDRFHPGARYDDFYDPIAVLIQGRISGDFFPDGRPRSSSFEYQAFLQSACYRRGKATCLSCHAPPHAPHHDNELRADDPDQGCRSCHAAVFKAGQAHTHHTAARAQRCVACHMPRLVSGVLDKFPDHTIDVPVPANSQRHGVPSACDLCHQDRSAAQLAGDVARLWPGSSARQARRLRLADAFDPRTAADSAGPLTQVVADRAEAPSLRGAASLLLAQRFAPRAAAAITPLLRSRDPLLRAKACEALGVAHARGAADQVARLLRDSSLRVRLAAALALEALGDARAEPALAALAGDPATERLLPPHLILGPLLGQRGDMAGARRELEAVVTLAPYYPDALEELAEVAARQGDTGEARRRIDECLRLDPGNKRARAMRSRL